MNYFFQLSVFQLFLFLNALDDDLSAGNTAGTSHNCPELYQVAAPMQRQHTGSATALQPCGGTGTQTNEGSANLEAVNCQG